jgi:uncharacterized RmlC-like cupin family protein
MFLDLAGLRSRFYVPSASNHSESNKMSGTHDHTHSHDHDHSNGDTERWKHDGVRVIPGNQLDPNVPSTAGMDRKAAINFARVGAQKLWAGTVTIRPDAKTGAHHHGHLESIIYVVKGKARMRWGEHLQFTAEAGPGDFIFVPPYVPHQEINASRDEVLECVLVRSDGEAVAINLDIEPVESRRPCCGSIPCIAIPPRRSEDRNVARRRHRLRECHDACSLREQWPRRHDHDGSQILAQRPQSRLVQRIARGLAAFSR